MKNPVLLLNSSYDVLNFVEWQKAIRLIFGGKARVPFDCEHYYRIPTPTGYYELPTTLVLEKYVHIPYKHATLTRRNIAKRDNFTCQYCDRPLHESKITLDHILPTSRGGKNSWTNLVVACEFCNRHKGDRTPEEAGMTLNLEPQPPTKKILAISSINTRTNRAFWKKYLP